MRQQQHAPKTIRDYDRVEEEKRLNEQVRLERNLWMERVLQLPEGRKVMSAILCMTGIFSEQWTGNSEMFRLSGMRRIGLGIQDWIKDTNFDLYVQVLREVHKDELGKDDVGTGHTKNR